LLPGFVLQIPSPAILASILNGVLRLRRNFACAKFRLRSGDSSTTVTGLLTLTSLFLFPEFLVFDMSPRPRTRESGSLPRKWARKRTSASPVLQMLKNNPDL